MKLSERKLSALLALSLAVLGCLLHFVVAQGKGIPAVGIFVLTVLALAILNIVSVFADEV